MQKILLRVVVQSRFQGVHGICIILVTKPPGSLLLRRLTDVSREIRKSEVNP